MFILKVLLIINQISPTERKKKGFLLQPCLKQTNLVRYYQVRKLTSCFLSPSSIKQAVDAKTLISGHMNEFHSDKTLL